MAIMLCTILFLTTLAQTGLAVDTSDSCVPLTTIGADLATLRLGEDMARYGYRRSVQVIFDELLAIVAGRSGHKHHAYHRAELAKNQSWTGFLLGTNPTLDAMRLLNTKLDVLAISQRIGVGFQPVSANIFRAIKKAQDDDHKGKKAELKQILDTVQSDVTNVVGIFNAAGIPNPAQTLSKEDTNVIECVRAKFTADLNNAVAAIFEGIYLLADALPKIKTKRDVEKYSIEILAIRKKAVEHFDAEVIGKYSIIRNGVIANFLEKTGSVTGLFALQSPHDDYLSV